MIMQLYYSRQHISFDIFRLNAKFELNLIHSTNKTLSILKIQIKFCKQVHIMVLIYSTVYSIVSLNIQRNFLKGYIQYVQYIFSNFSYLCSARSLIFFIILTKLVFLFIHVFCLFIYEIQLFLVTGMQLFFLLMY